MNNTAPSKQDAYISNPQEITPAIDSKQTPVTALGTCIWLLASFFFLYEFFLRTMIGTIATQIIPALHLTPGMFAFLGSAYYFAYGFMQIPVGIIADKFGLRHTLIFATIVCVFSTFCLSASTSFATALFCRVLMGLGSSFAFVCLLMVVSKWFPRKNFGFFSGASQFIGTMGPLLAAGPLASVLVKLNGDWRMLMTQIGLVGIGLIALMYLIVDNKPTNNTQDKTQTTPQEPMKPRLKRLLKNKQILYVSTYSALIYAPMALLGAIWGTLFLQAHGFSQKISADTISLSWLGYACGSLLLGTVSDLIRRRKTVLVICAALGLISSISIVFLPDVSYSAYGMLFAMLGVAAAGQSVACAAISEHADKSIRATAFGLNNGSVVVFNVTLPPLIGILIGLSASAHGNIFKPEDFILGFSVIPILYFFALFCSSIFIKETYCKQQNSFVELQPEPYKFIRRVSCR